MNTTTSNLRKTIILAAPSWEMPSTASCRSRRPRYAAASPRGALAALTQTGTWRTACSCRRTSPKARNRS
eukprot:11041843-Alexandrium_andersonii.AAC.1